MIHLGFDMGIRNLAFCLIEHRSDKTWSILAWDNVDLLAGGISAQDSRRCVACSGPAVWCKGEELWCKGCATGVRRKKTATRIPSLPVLPCGITTKDLKALGVEQGWATKKTKKEELESSAKDRFLFPWKAPKAIHPSLMDIRQKMDAWLDRMLLTFARADLIRLENQPVMKGPTMKSIQIMLFTLLGHRLEKEHGWAGRLEFVHAGTKSKGVAVEEDEGKAYRARKKTAEQDTLALLTGEWKIFFEGRSKKSDLADAFLMALRHS
jgi:hypothetical protein